MFTLAFTLTSQGWMEVCSSNGQITYHNPLTGETSYERPRMTVLGGLTYTAPQVYLSTNQVLTTNCQPFACPCGFSHALLHMLYLYASSELSAEL